LWDEKGVLLGSIFGSATRFASVLDLKKALRTKQVNVLPEEKMFLFTPILEWQNYYGTGRLEWAYDHWYWGQILYMIAMRWYERKADPPWVGYAPAEAEVIPDPEDTDETGLTDTDARQDGLGAISRAMGRIRSGGQAAIPSEPYVDEAGKPSNVRAYDIKELAVQDIHPAFLEMIDHLDKKKTRAILLPDSVLSRDRQVGTLGSVEAVVDIAVEIQNQILNRFVRAFNEQVLTKFLHYNGIKERATLVSPGVFRDNRSLIKEPILKAFEADMLAEQALGRQFPKSMTQTFDRQQAMRSVGIPYKEPDPNAPAPPPVVLPTQEALAGKDQISNNPSAKKGVKRDAGMANLPVGGKLLDVTELDFEADMVREAERTETWVRRQSQDGPARETMSTAEKATIAVALWMVLKARKRSADGRKVKGDSSQDSLVWKGATLRPIAEVAAALPMLDAAVSALEGRGLRLDPAGNEKVLTRARSGIDQSLGAMRTQIEGSVSYTMVESAIAQARASMQGLVERWDPQNAFVDLDPEEAKAIVDANVEGLLLNIENIARRNSNLLVEAALMGVSSGRQLGIVSDIVSHKFNELHSDLTLEAHLRAAYRNAVVTLGQKAGYTYFLKVPAFYNWELESAGDDLNWVAAPEPWWTEVGERRGSPNPHRSFGFHYGSRSFWYPVPPRVKIRAPLP
jgi:hypothetical protein